MGFGTVDQRELSTLFGDIGAEALIAERGQRVLSRDPGFGATLGAAFGQENLLVNAHRWLSAPDFEEDPGFRFDPEAVPERLRGFSDRFAGAKSRTHFSYMVDQAEAEMDRREILASSGRGSSLLAYAIAGISSPETLLPFGAGLKAVKFVGTGVRGAALTGAAVATAEQATAELALTQMQFTRTGDEAELNILGSALFGSVLGGVGGAIGKARAAAIQGITKKTVAIQKADADFFQIYETRRLGVKDTRQLDDAEIARIVHEEVLERHPEVAAMVGTGGSMVKRVWTKMVAMTPGIRGAVSDSTVMRIRTRTLSQTAIVRKGPKRSFRPSVEAETGLVQFRGIQTLSDSIETHKRYKAKSKASRVMNQDDFLYNSVIAARRETLGPDGLSSGRWDPPTTQRDADELYRGLDITDEVAVAALRESISRFRKFQNELGELGDQFTGHLTFSKYAPNSVSRTASSYVHRVYNLTAITSRRHEFIEVLKQGIKASNDEIDLNPDQILAVIQKIEGATDTAGHLAFSDAMGEARTLLIRDDFVGMVNGKRVAFEEFLDNDMASLLSKQIHVFAPRMILARRSAGPAHIKALRLRDDWEAIHLRLQDATESELPGIANELDKLERHVNDVGFLETVYGQGQRKWTNTAKRYEASAESRDQLMDRVLQVENQVRAAEAAVQGTIQSIDARLITDRAVTRALKRKTTAKKAGVVVQASVLGKLMSVTKKASADAKLEALTPDEVARLKEIEALSTETSAASQKALADLDALVSEDAATIARVSMAIEQSTETVEKMREAFLVARFREAETGQADPRTAWREDRISFLEGDIRSRAFFLEQVKGDLDRKLSSKEVREIRRVLITSRRASDRLAKEAADIDKAASRALAERVWDHAMRAHRLQGSLAPAYRAAVKIIKADPELSALRVRMREVRDVDVVKSRQRLGLERSKLKANQNLAESVRSDLASEEAHLRRLRKHAQRNLRKEDTAEFRVREPRRMALPAREAREHLATTMTKAFGVVSGTRQRLARNAENGKWVERQIRQDWDRMIRKASKDGDEKLARKLQRRKERDIEDHQFMVRQIVGSGSTEKENLGLQGSRLIRQFNYVTKMGGMMLSSIPDSAMAIFTVGFVPWLKMLARFLSDPRLKKMNQDELSQILIASEMTMGSMRMARIGDIADITGGINKAEGWLGRRAVEMTKWSGMARWNATLKAFTSVGISQRMNQIVRKGQDLTAVERQFLELSGIDDEMAVRINAQLDKHAEKETVFGLTVEYPKTQNWDDLGAREVYQAAVIQNVHRTVITPGAGELPRAIDNGFVRLALQFKSFSIAATQQIMLSGGQRFFTTGDMNVVAGLLSLVAMGAITELVKTQINQGHEKAGELFSKPGLWAVNAVDRSGIMGIFGDVNAVIERLSVGNIGLSAIHGETGQVSRYATRNLVSTVAGPAYGQINSLAQLATMPARWAGGGASGSDLTNIRRLMPFQNLWQVRLLLDDLGPRAVTGERRVLERWLVTDDDIADINEGWGGLLSQPVIR